MPSVLAFAVIDASGKLLHASGVQRVVHLEPGVWNVYFETSVANACEVASVAEWQTAGWISAYGEPSIAENEVTVWTGNFQWEGESTEGGDIVGVVVPTRADLTFQLAVVG